MGRPKGLPKTGGRKKGTPNKTTAELRAAILAAFDAVGGQDYLVGIAQTYPQVFCTLLSKLLPTQVDGSNEGPVQHQHSTLPDAERQRAEFERLWQEKAASGLKFNGDAGTA